MLIIKPLPCWSTGQELLERPALLALEEETVLVEWPLKIDTSVTVNFRASLIHLGAVELDTSTYGILFQHTANMYALYTYSKLLPHKVLSPLYSQNSKIGGAFSYFQFLWSLLKVNTNFFSGLNIYLTSKWWIAEALEANDKAIKITNLFISGQGVIYQITHTLVIDVLQNLKQFECA